MSNSRFDVVIVGAGAAGLLAGASAAARGRKTLILEKNKKLGVKILMSGGTRCNITHACEARDIVQAFGPSGRFLYSALAALPPLDVVQLVNQCGVETKVESTGKVFPVSDRAIDVRDALVDHALQSNCRIQNLSPVTGITSKTEGFQVTTDSESIDCQSVIITSGGKSYPGCGTTGDGYDWARSMGHSIVKPVPALTPILSRCEWANQISGVTIPDVDVRVLGPGESGRRQQDRSRRRASFLFTHFGFSGPAALDVSRTITQHDAPKSLKLVCDFLPERTTAELLRQFDDQKQVGGKLSPVRHLQSLLPKRLSEQITRLANLDERTSLAETSAKQLAQLVNQIKTCQFPINGTLGFEKAEVTAGGVSLNEVNSSTMQSKLVDGLYFAGEILDLDGPIGGFNFQSAFSTGWLAGQNA